MVSAAQIAGEYLYGGSGNEVRALSIMSITGMTVARLGML